MVGDYFCLQLFSRRASLPGALRQHGLQVSLSARAAKGSAGLQLDVAVVIPRGALLRIFYVTLCLCAFRVTLPTS